MKELFLLILGFPFVLGEADEEDQELSNAVAIGQEAESQNEVMIEV